MTFYFSRGIIKTLKTKKSLCVESVGKASSVASTIRFQETMIVQVSNICIITDKDQVEIVLNDTESSSNFFIDKNILRQYDTNKKQISITRMSACRIIHIRIHARLHIRLQLLLVASPTYQIQLCVRIRFYYCVNACVYLYAGVYFRVCVFYV